MIPFTAGDVTKYALKRSLMFWPFALFIMSLIFVLLICANSCLIIFNVIYFCSRNTPISVKIFFFICIIFSSEKIRAKIMQCFFNYKIFN